MLEGNHPAGSRLVRPNFPGAQNVFDIDIDIDALPAAVAFDHHLQPLAA
ncbi:hypothetical protein [Streptomyces albiflavescens]|nr:hypothetical protein [Streptomyces albiflavescens]